MTVSLPKTLMERIDKLARNENRTRSNWVVTELDAITADKLSVPPIFSEAGEKTGADAGGPSLHLTRSPANALPHAHVPHGLNEDAPQSLDPALPATGENLPKPRATRERRALQKMISEEKKGKTKS